MTFIKIFTLMGKKKNQKNQKKQVSSYRENFPENDFSDEEIKRKLKKVPKVQNCKINGMMQNEPFDMTVGNSTSDNIKPNKEQLFLKMGSKKFYYQGRPSERESAYIKLYSRLQSDLDTGV